MRKFGWLLLLVAGSVLAQGFDHSHKSLAALSAVPEAEFRGWTRPQQMAFLINAYNGFTIEKILTRYAELFPGVDLQAPVTFLEYDWTLNDFPSSSRR